MRNTRRPEPLSCVKDVGADGGRLSVPLPLRPCPRCPHGARVPAGLAPSRPEGRRVGSASRGSRPCRRRDTTRGRPASHWRSRRPSTAVTLARGARTRHRERAPRAARSEPVGTREWPRAARWPVSHRPSAACAGPATRRGTVARSVPDASASAALPTPRGAMPHRRTQDVRIRRLVALSSTMRTWRFSRAGTGRTASSSHEGETRGAAA